MSGLGRWLRPFVEGGASRKSLLPKEFRSGKVDRWLVGASLLLAAGGLVLIYSITSAPNQGSTAYLQQHFAKLAIGILFFVVALRIDYHLWGRFAPWLYLLGLAVLALVLVPDVGVYVKGARRWIRIGGQTLQPADFARLALVVYLAFLLSKPRERIQRIGSGLIPCLMALGAMVLFVANQPNLSTAVAFVAITGLMLVAGRIPWRHIAAFVVPAMLAAPFLLRGYQSSRFTNWGDYWLHGAGLSGGNYQLHQSVIALGSGGLLGRGLGESRQKWDYLPDARTDFIFAILGEELGFVGALVVIALLLVILWRAFEAARCAPDPFGSLLAVGIGGSIAVYGAINLMVVTGLFPTTGLPFPLVSYGGSAVIVTLFSLGILGNIASQGDSSYLVQMGDS